MAKLSEHGIRLSAMSPTYLHTNSTSHTWPFSAIAELIDNACDPGVCAKQMWIDVTKIKNELCLTFTDNGNGMTPIKLHKMLRNKDEKPELDFETDPLDIRIPDINSEDGAGKKKTYRRPEREDQHIPESDYSLRAYCSILYLKPRMQIILRKKKVKAQLITKSLAHIEYDVYRPNFNNKRVKITFGFNCKNKEQYGIMMYNKNRLIKSYEKVGCQIKSTSRGCGVGVIGIIECNFLKPAHNKQDFEYTKEYRLTMQALGQKLNDYWKEKKTKKSQEEADSTDMVEEPRDCSIPEEPEQSDDEMTPSYEKASKKHDQSLERKRWKSLEQEKRMQHSQLASITQRKDHSETGESEEEREEEVGYRTRSCSASLSTASGCSDNMNEERVVSSSLGLNSNKRKQSLKNQSWNKKRFKERAEVLAVPSSPDAAQSMEYGTVNSTMEGQSNSSDDDLIIIDDGATEGSKGSITHQNTKQEETKTVDFPNLSCINNITEENSLNSNGPVYHATAEKVLISEGTQTNKLAVIKKIETSSSGTREPADSHSNMTSQENIFTQKANEIDPNATTKCTAATIHFLEKQLDQARNLLDERTTERDCFRKENEEQTITIEQITKQLMEYQENAIQQVKATMRASLMENVNVVGPESWSLEEIKAYYKNIVQERDDLAQQLENAVKKMENCSSESKQLKEQLGKVEQERDQFKLEYEKMKHNLKASTNKGDDFYWTKKSAAAYRYSELELMRSEVEKLKGQKVELEEKLEEALRCNALCKEAWDPSTSQEVAQTNSVLTKLKSLRVKVGHLLGSVLPHLDLKDISYETDIIDEILEKVIEANKL
ncbi:MORC family CW-type zinc finger protein 4 isoform X2 [Chiloscyllium punctatum]|uniref:MORC family CW-type zinc finger protein 4 isoform X2 n=1 Tax=Chiloscyllium punctatum TaxID=137246 RepID=UPI003B63E199